MILSNHIVFENHPNWQADLLESEKILRVSEVIMHQGAPKILTCDIPIPEAILSDINRDNILASSSTEIVIEGAFEEFLANSQL